MGRTDPIGNLSCAIGEQTRETHLSPGVQRGIHLRTTHHRVHLRHRAPAHPGHQGTRHPGRRSRASMTRTRLARHETLRAGNSALTLLLMPASIRCWPIRRASGLSDGNHWCEAVQRSREPTRMPSRVDTHHRHPISRPRNVEPRNVIRLWDRCAFDHRNDLAPFTVTPSGCNRPKYRSRRAQSGCTQLQRLRGVAAARLSAEPFLAVLIQRIAV